MAPPRNLPPQAAQSVAGPFGPGARPDVSSLLQPHQSQLHLPPSQKRRWPDNALFVGNLASQESHKKLPSASRFGGPVAPCRYRPPQGPHKVAGPFGPGFLRWPESFDDAPHQPQRHVPPSQWRRCDRSAPSESNSAPQPSTRQGNFPVAGSFRGGTSPFANLSPQPGQSVAAPLGPAAEWSSLLHQSVCRRATGYYYCCRVCVSPAPPRRRRAPFVCVSPDAVSRDPGRRRVASRVGFE